MASSQRSEFEYWIEPAHGVYRTAAVVHSSQESRRSGRGVPVPELIAAGHDARYAYM